MWLSKYLIPYKKIIGMVALVLLVAVPVYLWNSKNKIIVEQDEKIEQLEDNLTFGEIDHVVAVENAVTYAQSVERNETLNEILKEIHNEANATDFNAGKFDGSIFDRMFLYTPSEVP